LLFLSGATINGFSNKTTMAKASVLDFENDLSLSQFTFKNLQEGVFWVNAKGQILNVNDTACAITGFSKKELLSKTVDAINASGNLTDFKSRWKQLKKDKTLKFEAQFRHKAGHLLDVEVTGNFILHEDDEFTCYLVQEKKAEKMEDLLLRSIMESTSAATGMDFLQKIATSLTTTLKMQFATIAECKEGDTTEVRTLCLAMGQTILDNIDYDTKGRPCEIILQGRDIFVPENTQKIYPNAAGVEASMGVPIHSSVTGKIIGHIIVANREPVGIDKNQITILKIFASRIGAEMERIKAEEKLKLANQQLEKWLNESEQRFRDLFEEAPIAYVHEGLDSKFIKANRAALRILGVKPEEVPFIYGKTLAPDTPDAQRRMKEAFESIGRGTDTSGVILEMRRKDNNKPIWIQWWSNPDIGEQFTRTMFIDITDKILMEQEQARLQAQNQYLQEEIKLTYNFEDIISKSKNFHKVLQQLEKVASTDATVLILGESGTGKELLARAVHNISNRSKRPLIKINCATLPANLIESELFGHERGAFTGAMERKIGRFELADGGTIFLDEIGELPVELQAKLLRVLQEGEFERLGNPKTIKVNVRLIAATNRNLQQAIEKKEFREDLFYRLNVFPIISPPLRNRKEDIPLLIKHFVKKYEGKMGKEIKNIPDKVVDALMLYDWPGNIRELENLIERALILTNSSTLEYGDWIPAVKNGASNGKASLQTMEDVEKEHIISVLNSTNWKVSGEKGAAKVLGLNATTLEARMKKLGIERGK
jgi:PAS domain S-box-containing protein